MRLRFVGAGKIFRGNLDRQMALPAIVGFEGFAGPKAIPPQAGALGIGKMIGLGVALGVVAVGGVAIYLYLKQPKVSPNTPTPASAQVDEAGKAILDKAKGLAGSGDLDGAHGKIHEIAPDSPVLDDPAVKDIEGKWADKGFDQFNKSTDVDERRKLVYDIAATPTVDADRRAKALGLLKEIDPEATDPLANPGQPPAPYPYPYHPPPPTGSYDPSHIKVPGGSSSKGVDPNADPLSAMNALKPQLGSGTLTAAQLRMLLALCIQNGDPACRNKAQAELKKFKKP